MKIISSLFTSAAVLLSTGCGSTMKNDYRPPEVIYPAQWQEPVLTSGSVPFSWQDFHDPQLEQWLQQVLTSNNDLAVAALRLYRAQLDAELVGIETAPCSKRRLEC